MSKRNVANILLLFTIAACLSFAMIDLSCSPSVFLKILDRYLHIENCGSMELQAMQSGSTQTVPWEDNPAFLKSREKNRTPVLMAAYETVLPNPLPGEEANVTLAAKKLAGYVVMPNKVFSQNAVLGPYDKSNGYQSGPTYFGNKITDTAGGGVCKIATTLYNVMYCATCRL